MGKICDACLKQVDDWHVICCGCFNEHFSVEEVKQVEAEGPFRECGLCGGELKAGFGIIIPDKGSPFIAHEGCFQRRFKDNGVYLKAGEVEGLKEKISEER